MVGVEPLHQLLEAGLYVGLGGAVLEIELAQALPLGERTLVTVGSQQVMAQPASAPVVDAQETDIAYVVYTSGSTGTPKGVEITHSGLTNLVAWHVHAFSVSSADRASHVSGLGFDASVWELWPYLAAGASLTLIDERTRSSPELLREWLLSDLHQRIRDVRQGPDGHLYLLTDEEAGAVLRIEPATP